ncbi:MAG: SIS domain-containing protein [Magnetococcales bacterium]|nr:SIS domain-containing protein [Magnetococcales bacterium]MBF0155758.1 SIS domain-containing protein [Magnetococcales bacterium]
MNELDRLYARSVDVAAFGRGYLDYLARLLGRIEIAEIVTFVEVLLGAREGGRQLFFLGNGGSAATASHFANDLAMGPGRQARPFRAVSLVDNIPILTAVANDDHYDQIFVRQLEILMVPGDVVVAISASGNSPNVVKAVTWANDHGGITVGLTGFDGGQLRRIARYGVHVPTALGEYGPVEDGHMVLDHLVSSYLIRLCRAEAGLSTVGLGAGGKEK